MSASKLDSHIGMEWHEPALRVIKSSAGSGFDGFRAALVPQLQSASDSLVPLQTSLDGDDQQLCFQWRNDVAIGETSAHRLNEQVVEFGCRIEFTQPFQSHSIGWKMGAGMTRVKLLNRDYRLATPPIGNSKLDATTPLFWEATNGRRWMQLVSEKLLPACDIDYHSRDSQSEMELTLWLDHLHAHPRFSFTGPRFWNWHNHYTFPKGHVLEANIRIVQTDQQQPAIVAGRFPDQRRALISITDHADHDTFEKVDALFYGSQQADRRDARDGFAGLKLPFTKSVFTQTDDAHGAGLHNPSFAELCNDANADSIEICPHGIHKSKEPALDAFAELIEPFKRYAPMTWIDHGRSFHCNYRLSGWDRRHTHNLHQVMEPLGIRCIWAGFDFGLAVPRRSLNQAHMHNFSGRSYIKDFPRAVGRAVSSNRPWAIPHEMAAIMFQMTPDRTMKQYFEAHRHIERFAFQKQLRSLPVAVSEIAKFSAQSLLPDNLRAIVNQYFGPRQELSMTPILYREHESIAEGGVARWLFNTIAVHDVDDAYHPMAVDQLIADYGLHVAHTYLTSTSRAHLSHAVVKNRETRQWQLSKKFAQNLRYMAQLRDEGELWVASIGEVCQFWEQVRTVSIRPEGFGEWTISKTGEGAFSQPIAIIGSESTSLARGSHAVNAVRINNSSKLANVTLQDQDLASIRVSN